MSFSIARTFRPVSRCRPFITNRHQIIKPTSIFTPGLRFNTNISNTSSTKPQSDKKDKETTPSSTESIQTSTSAKANDSLATPTRPNPDNELKASPEPVPKATPEEVIKKGQEAEEAREKDEQDNVQATTGVIEKKKQEGLIYFSNVYPVAPFSSVFLSRSLALALGLTEERVLGILSRISIPADFPATFTKIIPRYKDGGTFARFTIDKDAPAELTTKDVESVISQNVKASNYRPLFNPFKKAKVFTVLGIPWIEDLHRRVSNKVRVIFEGGNALNQETVYAVLRRYGPIKDISIQNDPKDPVKSAIVEYVYTRDASTARNCVNSLIVQNTQIHITYIPSDGGINATIKSIMDHSRISIPIILALLAALAVFVFNPIRVWFVEHKITNTSLPTFIENNSVVKWVRGITRETLSNIGRYLHKPADDLSNSLQSLWIERQRSARKIKQWLQENVNTFIVVTGPRGNGKRELVTDFVLKDRENVLLIDCEQLMKSQNDSTFIRTAASQIGYYPVFPWMNNISTYIDLIIQGMTGQKSGLSESTEQQFKTMLTTAVASIRKVSLQNYGTIVKNGQDKNAHSETVTSPKLTEEAYLQLYPESKPVIVISQYLGRADSNYQFVYKQLADFASILVQANLAHVIFITNDVTYESALTPALPNRIFKVAGISDADFKDAKRFVMNQILEARRTEAQASVTNEAYTPDSTNKKPEDLFIANDTDADKAKEEAEVAKMKEELVKEETSKGSDKDSIATKILSYTTGAFYSDKNSGSEAQGQNESSTNTIDDSPDDFDDSETIAFEYPYLDYALSPLGGRLTDLQSFARRLKSGEEPLLAAEDMVTQSAAEIYQMFLMRNQRMVTSSETASSASVNEWTHEQAWTLIKLLGNLSSHKFTKERQIALADSGLPAGYDRGTSHINKYSNITHNTLKSEPEVSISFLLQDPNFKTKDQQKALTALQRAEMITLVHESGRNVAIKAGKPLYQAAFKALIDDKVLYSIQETMLLNSLIGTTNKKIKEFEDELATLSLLNRSYEVKQRIKYLEKKMMVNQTKVSGYEEKLKLMANIMSGK